MIGHQIKIELSKALKWKQIIIWCALILVLPTIKFLLIKENYVYYRHLDLFLRLNSDFITLLFPILMVLVYTTSFIGEQKNNFIQYTRLRIPLTSYLLSKLLTNAMLTFIIAFLMVFIPFVFAMYIEPSLGIVKIYPLDNNPLPLTTFEQLLFLGNLPYGIIYSIWVGLNGMLLATIALLLLIVLEKPFLALSIPFMYYLVITFILQTLGYDQFSPVSTIFPFTITQQPLWTIFPSFAVFCISIIVISLYLKKKIYRYE